MAWNRGRKERHDGPKRDALIDVDMLMPHSWRWFAQLRWAEGERGLGFRSWEGSGTSIVHNFDYKKQITTLAAPPYLSDHSRIFITIIKFISFCSWSCSWSQPRVSDADSQRILKERASA